MEMSGLQRSTASFRRQGSSGLVWDDRFLSGELNRLARNEEDNKAQEEQLTEVKQPSRGGGGSVSTIERSRSNGGGRAFGTGRVNSAIEPPSPRVSACGFCGAFGKRDKTRRRPKSGKRRT